MRRRSRAGGEPVKTRRRKSAARKRGIAPKGARRRGPSAASETKVSLLTRELNEALERQTATAEILKIISASPTELQPVLEVVVKSAARFCEADDVTIFELDGQDLRAVAHWGPVPQDTGVRFPCSREHVSGRAVLERRPIHIIDLQAEVEEFPEGSAFAKRLGHRTTAGVPLLREGMAIGTILLRRAEINPFADKQIALLETFAAQAVIAIENTRLLRELRHRTVHLSESLEQQTATSEVLKVISSSTGELQPVFQAVLENATRLCAAKFGLLYLCESDAFRATAMYNVPPAFAEARRRDPLVYGEPGSMLDRLSSSRQTVHIPDVTADASYIARLPRFVLAVELGGFRAILAVPMLKGANLIGVITIYRQETGRFSDKQIELVQNFAAQAVIAIENARLLSELRQRTTDLTEALEQQTATSEVLKVISSAQGELQTVFDAILENATRICEANFGNLTLYDGEVFRRVALYNAPSAWATDQQREPRRTRDRAPLLYQLADTKAVVHVADAAEVPGETIHKFTGARSLMIVPMLKGDKLVGGVGIYRQEVRPFSDKQIALLQNFAAQAVIAIENARLLNELRQSLEQQTATSEVLRVISSSLGELEPVFGAMLQNSVKICEAGFGQLFLCEGNHVRLAATIGVPTALVEFDKQRGTFEPTPGGGLDQAMRTKQVVHVADLALEHASYPPARLGGARSYITVPMLKDDVLIGIIAIYRQEVRPFTERQIELLTNFAAQAVIAIENTRLLNELRQSLEQQTATADVLRVISSSPGELNPVFDSVLDSATRLCEANFGTLYRYESGTFRAIAQRGAPPAFAEFQQRAPIRPTPVSGLGRIVSTRQPVHIIDTMAEQRYIDGEPYAVTAVKLSGSRTLIFVPMLKDDDLIGAITIYRREVRPFTEKQIELLQNFAAQAVIAIENTRLLNELRESLQQQTATADVLKVISRSTFDLRTVLQTLVESAAKLCDADQATITREKDGAFYRAEAYGFSREFMDYARYIPIKPERGSASGRALLEGRVIHIPDVKADPEYTWVEAQRLGAFRTILCVPMLREGIPIGVLTLSRLEVRPFTDKQIALVTTFADQAAIAIENVRLFEVEQQRTQELAKSLQDLRATQDRLVQTQKLASLGQLTAGIAHEIKNPLNFVNNFSGLSVELIDELEETLGRVKVDETTRGELAELAQTLRGNLGKIAQHGQRADSIVKNMLLHSREGSGEHRPVDINAIVEESLNLAYHGARAEKQGFTITLEQSLDPSAGEVDVFPQEITRVLLNLISNAFYAATKRKAEMIGDDYEPTVTAVTKDLGDRVEIRIRDNGTGIPAEVKDKMFNPFFTTKPAGEGTGLGLSISHDIIVKQHAGSIEVDTQPGEFTEFRITLPRTGAGLIKS